jgi:hypothetical protein
VTSTKHRTGALALLAGLALGLGAAGPGPGHQPQRKERAVELMIWGDDHYWIVSRDGDRLVAERFRKGDNAPHKKTFRDTASGLEVGGRLMAYDPEGRSKDVRAREYRTPAAERRNTDTRWDRVGDRFFGMRLRVPKGPLKGWWVGLGPAEPVEPTKADRPAKAGSAPPRARARLVLVKDKEDAAAFCWADPKDEGP